MTEEEIDTTDYDSFHKNIPCAGCTSKVIRSIFPIKDGDRLCFICLDYLKGKGGYKIEQLYEITGEEVKKCLSKKDSNILQLSFPGM